MPKSAGMLDFSRWVRNRLPPLLIVPCHYLLPFSSFYSIQAWALFQQKHHPHKNLAPYYSTNSSSFQQMNLSASEAAMQQTYLTDVRNLFKTALTLNKYHSASWIAWAKFEQRTGNRDIARRLLISGISKFPNSHNIGTTKPSLHAMKALSRPCPVQMNMIVNAI
jgi:hypothetical protein